MFYREMNGDKVHYIDDRRFQRIMEIAEPLEYAHSAAQDAWRLSEEIEEEKWEAVESFNSGDKLEWGCNEWEQNATLYKYMEGCHLLEVRMTYFGKDKKARRPLHYEVGVRDLNNIW